MRVHFVKVFSVQRRNRFNVRPLVRLVWKFRRLGKKKEEYKYACVEMNHCASTSTITMLTLMHVWVKALGAEPGLHGYLRLLAG